MHIRGLPWAALAVLLALTAPCPTLAQETLTQSKGQFTWTFHAERKEVVGGLMEMAPRSRGNICSLLPACGKDQIQVLVAESESEFLEIQPERVHIDWAAGVAWPDKNLIVLRVDKTMLLSFEETFEHELSHLLLYQSVKRDMPRWFVEGLAILQSERNMIERFEAVAGATVSDSLFTLEQLDAGFPSTISGRGLAYAQSGMFVSWMFRVLGRDTFKEMLVAMAHGQSVEEAVRTVSGTTLASLEEQWHEGIGKGAWLKGLSDSWLLWSTLALVVVVGALLRRRRNIRKKAIMGGDDGPDWEFR